MPSSKISQQLNRAGLRTPCILTISITGTCNLACCHCWVKAGESSSAADVPQDKLRRLVEEFAAIGGDGIRITGGEPLCHPYWLDILKLSCLLGFKTVALQTNAILLNEKHVAALRELAYPGLSIQISLDGATAQTHDLVRGKGAFSGALQGITKLVQGGLAQNISFFFTEMRHNLAEIPELLDFADSISISSVSTGSMVICGRAAETRLIEPPEVGQYLDLLEHYNSNAHFRDLYSKFGNVAALEWRSGETIRQDCCTFISNPYITPSGRIYPCLLCHTDEFSVTGVFEKGLAASLAEGIPLWSSLLHISHRRTKEISECQDCSAKLCCAGGCMGRAWGSCGNLNAADDRCELRQAIHLCVNSPL